MTAPDTGVRSLRVLVGYDGSPSAVNAIEAAATLLPSVTASILHLWEPPFTSPELRHRVFDRAANPEALGRLIESAGRAEAARPAGTGAQPPPPRRVGAAPSAPQAQHARRVA